MNFKIKDIKLASRGKNKIEMAQREMPVLGIIRKTFEKKKPFLGLTVAACLHITKETAVLLKALRAGGALVAACGSNPLSTQDDIAAALARDGIKIFAWRGIDKKKYYWCLNKILDFDPRIVIDDGADLISLLHGSRKSLLKKIWAGQEETTTGVSRLRAMAAAGKLKISVMAVNDAPTKHMFDNYYGTGQSTVDALMRATNILLASKVVAVAGYGFCGKGIAARAKGMGARVIVAETDYLKALQAAMDGFEVMTMSRAAKIADIFLTATGNKNVIAAEHMKLMKDGGILGNSGHFNVEINVSDLEKLAVGKKQVREDLTEYKMKNGRRLYLVAEGRLMNLVAAEGHPSAVMDMSFANQALTCEWLVKNYKNLGVGVYSVPSEIDKRVAKLKLLSLGVKIDILTSAQKKYLVSWSEGT